MSDIRSRLRNHPWAVAAVAGAASLAGVVGLELLFGDGLADSVRTGIGCVLVVGFVMYGEVHAVDDEQRETRASALRTRWLLRLPLGKLGLELLLFALVVAALTFPVALVTHHGLIGALGSWVILDVLLYAFMYRRGRLRASARRAAF